MMNTQIIKDMSLILNMSEKEVEGILTTLENVILHNIIESLLKQKKQTIELPWEIINFDLEENKITFEIPDNFKNEICYGVKEYSSPLSQQLMSMLSKKLIEDFDTGELFDNE